MPRAALPDLSICLETLLEPDSPPRRRPPIEGQEARCPRCERIMIVRMGRRLPEYHCACQGKES
jgi:hypothetical protein